MLVSLRLAFASFNFNKLQVLLMLWSLAGVWPSSLNPLDLQVLGVEGSVARPFTVGYLKTTHPPPPPPRSPRLK